MIEIIGALEIPMPQGVEPRTTLVLYLDVDGRPWILAGIDPSLDKAKILQVIKDQEADISRQAAGSPASVQYPLSRPDLIT